ncbi:hypothetical protein [Paenimyroides ceti]
MKKIITAVLFLFLGLNMSAQELVPLKDLQSNPNEVRIYSDKEVILLDKQLKLSTEQAKELKEILYSKYKNLSQELNSDQILQISQGVRERIRIVLGSEKYTELAKNEVLLNIITGAAYLN